jgi:hypothetical protein
MGREGILRVMKSRDCGKKLRKDQLQHYHRRSISRVGHSNTTFDVSTMSFQ